MTTETLNEDMAYTPEELHLLQLYRTADAAGKIRLIRMLSAGARGFLPPVGGLKTPEEIDRFLDSLPELLS